MTATLQKLSAKDVQDRLATGRAVLVDIRERDEFARSHIPGALSQPLSALEQMHLTADPDADVIFTCHTGMRTSGACDRLAARVTGAAYVLDGGIDAWVKAGLPIATDAKAPLEINRQVQITAGLLVLTSVVLGLVVAPAWFALAGFLGAGLTFAGISGSCGLARLLMMAPWNRRAAA